MKTINNLKIQNKFIQYQYEILNKNSKFVS